MNSFRTICSKSSALLSVMALLSVSIVSVHQASAIDELTTAVTSGTATASATDEAITFTFATASTALAAGDKMIITVPSDFGNFSNIVAGDVSVTTSDTSINNAATETFNTSTQTIEYVLAGGETAAAAETVTVTIGSANFLTMPATGGQYSFHITLKDSSDVVTETGFVLVSVSNTVTITATVAEALIMTIDTSSVALNVDPGVNNGEDNSQKSVLTVSTNANSGYKIQAALDNGVGAAGLRDATSGATIASGDSFTTENRFGYVAYNANETKTDVQLKADAANAQTFSNSSANLTLFDGTADGVEGAGATNSQDHTVYYTLNTDFLTSAGNYGGTLTYTAVPTF